MNKDSKVVPKGIRYISEWLDFSLPEFPCIINKQITGCGFTEYCLRSNQNIVLVSPRRILLENKKDQHPENNVFYFKNESEAVINYDKDLTAAKIKIDNINTTEDAKLLITLKDNLKHLLYQCKCSNVPCKILVTYDSFRHVKEVLENELMLENFHVVVDEFQSIFTDSKFKSSTEMELLNHLQSIQKLCFISATPMLDRYMEMLNEFNTLPYYELDWETEDPDRVVKPELEVYTSRSIGADALSVINSYISGVFEDTFNINGDRVFSKEAVLYFNSVKTICTIISRCNLSPDQCNVLCARTEDNEKKIRRAFGLNKRLLPNPIGEVPKEGEPHKMFTFCTRTVYLGADFYSTNARTFIFSDANIDCLAVDVTLDLPQILGRQRLVENPWKNRAILYVKLNRTAKTQQEFNDYLDEKKKVTYDLLDAYVTARNTAKHSVAITYQQNARAYNYKNNFVAVNEHAGSDILPVFNNLVLVAEMRSFEIQQFDYKDRFTLFSSLKYNNEINPEAVDLENLVIDFDSIIKIKDKYRYLSSLNISEGLFNKLLERIPVQYKNHCLVVGRDRFSAFSYTPSEIDKEYKRLVDNYRTANISDVIYSSFNVGEKYTKADLKDKLGKLYESIGYSKTPKASDILDWFEVSRFRITDKETGKRNEGFELIKKK